MPVEIEYNLDSMLPQEHFHGIKNKDVKFNAFAQSASVDDLTPDIFQVHFLTESGHLYSMCPVLTRTVVLREQHYSQIDLLLTD